MDLRMFQIDAFTSELFSGNPAAVVPLGAWLDDALLQNIAAENNLSETAFIVPLDNSNDRWHIRWFTPAVEVPLCGHATLASAAVIRREFAPTSWPIELHSASGILRVDVEEDTIILDFPANPSSPVEMPWELGQALAAEFEECRYTEGFYLLTVEDEAGVRSISPDFGRIGELGEDSVIVTAPGDSVDFVSRFFAPGLGIDEDPVTGAAHCVLTPYWAERLSKNLLNARQISRRGGDIGCELKDDRVRLSGRAVFYLEGRLLI